MAGKNDLVRQMGNARLLITHSTTEFKNYELACKFISGGRQGFKEKKFTRASITNGTKYWFLGNKFHRVDGPAIEWGNGGKEWYLYGKRHRVDGPAIIKPNGNKIWVFEGKYHRLDGPAIEWSDGTEEWWINGKRIA